MSNNHSQRIVQASTRDLQAVIVTIRLGGKNIVTRFPGRGIIQPTDKDILCGRGKHLDKHHGNLWLTRLAYKFQGYYHIGIPRQKRHILSKIIDIVKHEGRRFLKLKKLQASPDLWYWVQHPPMEREKVRQKLRDTYRKLEGSALALPGLPGRPGEDTDDSDSPNGDSDSPNEDPAHNAAKAPVNHHRAILLPDQGVFNETPKHGATKAPDSSAPVDAPPSVHQSHIMGTSPGEHVDLIQDSSYSDRIHSSNYSPEHTKARNMMPYELFTANCSPNLLGALTANLLQRAQASPVTVQGHQILAPFDELATIVSCHGIRTLLTAEHHHQQQGSDEESSAGRSVDQQHYDGGESSTDSSVDSATSFDHQDNSRLDFNPLDDSFLNARLSSACSGFERQNSSSSQHAELTTTPPQEDDDGVLGALLEAFEAQNSL